MRHAPLQPLLAAAALLAAAGLARSQPAADEGPVIVGERKQAFKNFELLTAGAALDFYWQRRFDKLEQPGQPDRVDQEDVLRETVNLFGTAAIGHRNLIELKGDVTLGLEDRFIDSDSQQLHAHEDDFTNLFDVSAKILQAGPAPVELYARRDETLLNRAFAGSIRSTIFETGAIVELRSEVAPVRAQYYHREQEDSGLLGANNLQISQDTVTVQSNIRLGEHQRLSIDYTFDHVNQDQSGLFSDEFDRHNGTAVHSVDFGPEERYNLQSSLSVYDQSGLSEQRIVNLNEILRLRHSEQFETFYNGVLRSQETRDTEQRLARGSAGFRHELFDSLVTTGTIGADWLEIPGEFESNGWFIQGALDYTKLVPLGRLNAGAGGIYNSQSNGPRGTTVGVANEVYTFNDPLPITINRRNIIPSSVFVTDAQGVRTYLEGPDYTLRAFPDRIELRRVVGGAIADGETVRVSYDIGPEPPSDIETTGFTLSARYTLTEGTLAGLAFYTIYQQVDNSIDTEAPELFVLDDFQDLRYGVEYTRGPLTLLAEQQARDSTVNPYDRTRLEARYEYRISRESALTATATHEIIDYTAQDDRLVFTYLDGRWDQRLTRELDMTVRLLYRDEQSDLSGDTRGFEQLLDLHWRRRQTTIYASFRNAFLEGNATDTLSQTIQVGLRREF